MPFRKYALVFMSAFLFLGRGGLWALQNHIHFQGRLTDSAGQPIVGTTQVKFEVYDALENGTLLWPVLPADGNGVVDVATNEAGLFETDIGPFQDVFFSTMTNYFIQIYVDNFGFQALSPRKQLSTVPFSFHAKKADLAVTVLRIADDTVDSAAILNDAVESADIKDNDIRSEDIQDGAVGSIDVENNSLTSEDIMDESVETVDLSTTVAAHLIPSGMIALFDGACPDGWTRFGALDNRFPLGKPVAGVEGGTDTHHHSISMDGGHAHSTVNTVRYGVVNTGSGTDKFLQDVAAGSIGWWASHYHATDTQGSHDHDGHTADQTVLPPYRGMVYCTKD